MKVSVLMLVVLAGTANTVTRAGDLFERKSGLWKITMHGPAAASTHTADQCLASDTDARLARKEMATLQALCSKIENRKVGKTFVTDSVCKIGAHASTSHTLITPDGDGAYQTVVATHDDTAAKADKPDQVFTQDGHWEGDCPASMKPGDQILHVGPQMPNGMKTNLLDSSPAG
jgi:hypothetical protein